MNTRNSTSKVKNYSLSSNTSTESNDSNNSSFSYGNNTKTRKKREELSCNASKSIKKESVDIVLDFKEIF